MSKFYQGVFYKERWIKENDLEQRFIVTYSLKYRNYQSNIHTGQIERAKKMAANGKTKNHKNQNDPARFLKVITITKEGEVAEEMHVTVDQDAIDKEAIFDGYYGVCTT